MTLKPFREEDFPSQPIIMTGILPPVSSELEYHREMVGFYCRPTPEEMKLYSLANEFIQRVEAFDLKTCSGRDRKGKPTPSNTPEYLASTRHADMVRQEIEARAYREGFTNEQLKTAIHSLRKR